MGFQMPIKKGFFKPHNPDRYQGDPTNIVYRSSWERKMMFWLDTNSAVEWWKNEEVSLPYFDKTRGHPGRYFPDFVVKFKNGQTIMVEIKPKAQTMMPTKKNDSKSGMMKYMKECVTFAKNQCKWEAATKYCEERNWKFVVFNEEHLGITYNEKH
jgi:hypothetical protein